jgi:hypothetical protein
MKISSLLLSIPALLSLLFIMCCDEIDELTKFDVDTVASTFVDISVGANDDLLYSENYTIFLDDPDIVDNIERIEDYEIKSIKYRVVSYDGVENITAIGNLFVGSSVDIQFNNVNLYQLWLDGTEVDTGVTSGDLNNLAAELKTNGLITGLLTVELTDRPLFCTIEVLVEITATVDAG